MAVTITPLGGLTGVFKVILDTDADDTVEANVCDGATTIYTVTIDNTANAAVTYLKFWDLALSESITLGTTVPDMILFASASATTTYVFKDGNAFFTTALSYAAVTAGGTAGVTAPTSNVLVTITAE